MGVFSALTTAVSGMQAQSYALENISGNIANSRTTGFKRIETSFVDLIPDSALNRELAGTVAGYSRSTNTQQGDISATGISTNIAVNGDGFFVVDRKTSGAGGTTSFSGSNYYTRRGDFDFDADGYLTNGAGYYLKGFNIDAATGEAIGTQANLIQVTQDEFPARASTTIDYRVNLPSYPGTLEANSATANSELLDPADFSVNPTTTGSNTVVGADLSTFLRQSVSGGSVTVYDQLGQPVNVELRWAKTNSVGNGGADTWNLFVAQNTGATGTAVAYRNVGTPVTFGSSGQLTSAPTITLPAMTIGGTAVSGLVLATGGSGLTQYADTSGQIQAKTIKQDGYAAGTLDRVAVDADGKVLGTFSNGQVVPLAQVAVAKFNATNNLKRLDGGAYEQTLESGTPVIGVGASQVVGSSVEASNTDIADEFSKMIVTQQAYSANTKIISTAQQMLQDAFNIIR